MKREIAIEIHMMGINPRPSYEAIGIHRGHRPHLNVHRKAKTAHFADHINPAWLIAVHLAKDKNDNGCLR